MSKWYFSQKLTFKHYHLRRILRASKEDLSIRVYLWKVLGGCQDDLRRIKNFLRF